MASGWLLAQARSFSWLSKRQLVLSFVLQGSWANLGNLQLPGKEPRLLPDPPKFPELEGELPEPMARSLHFLGGGDVLLITYMDHGVM